jgi:hypothetical protein
VIQEWLRDAGLDVERRSNNVLARGPRRQKAARAARGTQRHRFRRARRIGACIAKAGRLYARGAADMKSGLAVMVGLARDLDLAALAYDVAFVVYEREEGPILANGLGPLLEEVPWLHEAALAFVLEPSDNTVQVGAMGHAPRDAPLPRKGRPQRAAVAGRERDPQGGAGPPGTAGAFRRGRRRRRASGSAR